MRLISRHQCLCCLFTWLYLNIRLDSSLITYRWHHTFFETIYVDFIRVTPSGEEVCHLETLETIACFTSVLSFQAKHGLLKVYSANLASSSKYTVREIRN